MLPIIFVHRGNRAYLPLSLWKAKATNPRSDIILIGDRQNAHWATAARHYTWAPYGARAEAFARSFRNFGPNRPDFELVCFQRWLVLQSFLRAHHIDHCLYIDSDVLLYGDVEADARRFSAYGMTTAGISGHTNFIRGPETLGAFCDLLVELYRDERALAQLGEQHAALRHAGDHSGISDMTFFQMFAERHSDSVLDIARPLSGCAYDESLSATEGFAHDNGIKTLRWSDGAPVAETANGEPVKMRSLHFQGDSKQYMRAMAHLDSHPQRIAYQLNRPYVLGQRAWNWLARRA